MSSVANYPCPCCGYLVFIEKPGSYDICHICRWEDDASQLRWPTHGGANLPLLDAQRNYAACGVSDPRLARYAKAPDPARDRRDPTWRPLQPSDLSGGGGEVSIFERMVEIADPSGDRYYYWRAAHDATDATDATDEADEADEAASE